jgi:hypothetical protein
MAFDITQSYSIVADADGNKYFSQGGTLYNSSYPYATATQNVVSDTGYLVKTVQIDSSTGLSVEQKSTSNAANFYPAAYESGAENPTSLVQGRLRVANSCNVTVLTSTSAVTIGVATANSARLKGIVIMLNGGGAVTATVTGFENELGAAKSLVLTGSATVDTVVDFGGLGLINSLASLTVAASVADKVLVLWENI